MSNLKSLIKQYLEENYSPKEMVYLSHVKLTTRKIEQKPKPTHQKIEIDKNYTKKAPSNEEKSSQPIIPSPASNIEKTKPIISTPAISLEKPKKHQDLDIANFTRLYKKIAPHIPLYENPPNDSLAINVQNAYKDHTALVTIPIFVDKSIVMHAQFLINLAKAIDTLAPSRVIDISEIEKENRWPQLLSHKEPKLIIVPNSLLFQSKNLITHYREVGQNLFKKLGEIPTLVLKDIDAFTRSPAAKESLWKLLKEEIPKIYER